MLRPLMGAGLMLVVSIAGAAHAQSSCDAAVTKAIAKNVGCKLDQFASAYKSGRAVDAAKLARCGAKFDAACASAKSRGGCQAQAESCSALAAEADAAVDDLRGTTPTSTIISSTTSTTLDPLRPCGEGPAGVCGGVCERGECAREPFSNECVCYRPCDREGNGTCGGICDFHPAEQCIEDADSGECVCFLPCMALGGIGQCQGDCPAGQTCSFTGSPSAPCGCF